MVSLVVLVVCFSKFPVSGFATYCCVARANRGNCTMVFKRLDVILQDVIENARKGGGRPPLEDCSRPPCAGEGGQSAQSELDLEKARRSEAPPVIGVVSVSEGRRSKTPRTIPGYLGTASPKHEPRAAVSRYLRIVWSDGHVVGSLTGAGN